MKTMPQVLLLLVLLAATGGLGAAQETAAEAAAPAYAGSDTCEACHSDIFAAFKKNAHAVVEADARRGWQGKACEACHGPGAKHLESMEAADIRNPAKIEPMVADRGCLECHIGQPTHVGRIQGGHARNQVACVSCHPVHGTEELKLEPHPARRINQECSECHSEIWASFQRPHGHNLPQGAMACTGCHNPHGTFQPQNMRNFSSNEPGCFQCHSYLRGPFVFEHAPVRMEGCQSCHEPHGSANPRLLIRHEVSNLCLECHANISNPDGSTRSGALGGIPTGFHDLRSARFRNCTTCHVKIHGSHANRDFLR